MARSRVLSFMSQWAVPRSPTSETPPSPPFKPKPSPSTESTPPPAGVLKKQLNIDTNTPPSQVSKADLLGKNSPSSPTTMSRARGDSRLSTRPQSMIQAYQPPQVEVAHDTPPELQPIFSFLNSHSNKLYQEGYFLKLHDLDSRGRPSADRVWNECFAQLVGTVLSLWDAAALDQAGEDGEVVPSFVNLSDASIKMIESLPMNGAQGGSLQNVLSISTAANNRYLLHFNSLNSLTQWTAGIRLAMFEHSTLQEAYTGSLIAGKGRLLNNIKSIMERSKYAHEDWARVRFGAGTPWRRCWCVISQPDEKEFQKAEKKLRKVSVHDKSRMPRGDIKFYDTRKLTKKTRPIATITDAYAAYAIYPQSKPLIDQSTLVKMEGLVTIHTSPESTSEGFVFVMPEVHAAVTGFEMMLRWLLPVFDTFGLYGRPSRLIADTLDQRGLMFAMPRDRRYGYLDTLDVSGLIHTQGSQGWTERQWRREMKKLTSTRMMSQIEVGPDGRSTSLRRNTPGSRTSLPPTRGGVRFDDGVNDSIHSSPGSRSASPMQVAGMTDPRFVVPKRVDSAPPRGANLSPHKRSVSDAPRHRNYMTEAPSRLSYETGKPDDDYAPAPPAHGGAPSRSQGPGYLPRIQSGAEVPTLGGYNNTDAQYGNVGPASPVLPPPTPVLSPPAFTHSPSSRPAYQPYAAPELRHAHSNVDAATLYQMQEAARGDDAAAEEWGGVPPGVAQQAPQSHQTVVSNAPASRSFGPPADQSAGVVSSGVVSDGRNALSRDPRQRLSTIQGSPYVSGNEGVFQSPDQVLAPAGLDAASDRRPMAEGRSAYISETHGTHSIARKPVPHHDLSSHQPHAHTANESAGSSSPVEGPSWEGQLIDQEALERILNEESRNNTMMSKASTPDYASVASASTRESQKKPAERPRAGKLKIVGDPDFKDDRRRSYGAGMLDTWEQDAAVEKSRVPNIDFGPTLTYKPTSQPGTSGTMTPGGMHDSRRGSGDQLRNQSAERLMLAGAQRISPADSKRHSYFGGRNTPSPNMTTPTSGHPGASDDRTPAVWQPGAVAGSPGASQHRQSLTPEQWVQYKAELAAQRQQASARRPPINHSHQRTASGTSINQLRSSITKTPPPLSHTPSGDWTQQAQPRTPPSRPQSRGANAYLGASSPGTVAGMAQQAPNLSAKEQMHVARATGSPLVNSTSIAQREKAPTQQRSASASSSAMMQQAIAMRQQQQLQQQQQQEAEAHAAMQYQMAAAQQAHFQFQANQMQEQLAQQQMLLAQQQGPVLQQQQWRPQQPGAQRVASWQTSLQRQQYEGTIPAAAQPAPQGFAALSPQRQWEAQQAAMRAQQGGDSNVSGQHGQR